MNNFKRVLVTGGSRGIGRAIVSGFVNSGCQVAFMYEKNDSAADEVVIETGAYAIKCDISDPYLVSSAVESAVEALGGIDVLVNNAAISKIGLFSDMSDDEWTRMTGVNLSGAFYVTREASRYMIAQQSGRIINIGSMWGKTGASCEVAYSTTKAGIRGFTMALAKELGPSGITVNCVEPGIIDTEMNSSLSDDAIEELVNGTPLCRLGDPEDVANAVLFLASDKASFITGQVLGGDGGYAI
jgi:3-oxoacyl-[acyl-carrier protein] reductase